MKKSNRDEKERGIWRTAREISIWGRGSRDEDRKRKRKRQAGGLRNKTEKIRTRKSERSEEE